MSFLVLFCNHLAGEERAGCFTFVVFCISCRCYRSLILIHGVMAYVIVAFPGHIHLLFKEYLNSIRTFAIFMNHQETSNIHQNIIERY